MSAQKSVQDWPLHGGGVYRGWGTLYLDVRNHSLDRPPLDALQRLAERYRLNFSSVPSEGLGLPLLEIGGCCFGMDDSGAFNLVGYIRWVDAELEARIND